ncbi:hypothetical protein [Polluticoccus soli]|uniref:hypothetical protein n=1 Tax=Polluticoccus soli TaxID=3034150 RepID=UPI0023E2BEC4|nr:hypothetical protein [Flavipsychrobacter sp. JY13-12]
MPYRFALLFFILFSGYVRGQQNCICPSGTIIGNVTKPAKTFSFNGGTIVMCGGYTENGNVFSEFLLYDCRTEKIIGEWDATQSCTLVKSNDTLIVSTLRNWPIGKNYEFNTVPFYISKLYYEGNTIKELDYYLSNHRRYSDKEIQRVITNYQNYKPGNNSDTTINFAYLLFWSYVSGSKKAEQYLNTLESRCGPFDGAISEEWNEIIMTYAHYKELAGKGLVQTN